MTGLVKTLFMEITSVCAKLNGLETTVKWVSVSEQPVKPVDLRVIVFVLICKFGLYNF